MRKFYECLIYSFIRGYISKGFCEHPAFIAVKRELDHYNKCWLYKILKRVL